MTGGRPARRVAYDVLRQVREADAYANLLLPVRSQRERLTAVDAALATELTYGTLRRLGYYDSVIQLAAGRSTAQIDPQLLDVLRLGAHQLLSMRIPPHAAVNEAVLMAKTVSTASAGGFVNGVLRAIARTDRGEWQQRVLNGANTEDDRLSLLHSHPKWVLRAFRKALAALDQDGELVYLLEADNAPPRVSLVALPGLADRTAAGSHSAHAEFSPIGTVLGGGDPLGLSAVRAGVVRVQDEGSQLAALALSRARPVQRGEQWLDLCAGPGGKSALLAAEARLGGASLTANEPVAARAGLVRRALAAVPGEHPVLQRDGRGFGAAEPDRYDRVLVDAPCTGLGALRRRPEARWRRTPEDVTRLAPLQAELLDSGLRTLKPGGVLAYVTCSPHLAETRQITDAAVDSAAGRVIRLDTPAVLETVTGGALRDAAAGSAVQLWPHRHGTDAMYICLLTKTQ